MLTPCIFPALGPESERKDDGMSAISCPDGRIGLTCLCNGYYCDGSFFSQPNRCVAWMAINKGTRGIRVRLNYAVKYLFSILQWISQ
jgi:hypothetical protein